MSPAGNGSSVDPPRAREIGVRVADFAAQGGYQGKIPAIRSDKIAPIGGDR